jgi:hypothetical protein
MLKSVATNLWRKPLLLNLFSVAYICEENSLNEGIRVIGIRLSSVRGVYLSGFEEFKFIF